jgi:cell division initiation protein
MYTAKDIRSTTFDLVKKGYSTADVDSFLNKIAGEYEELKRGFDAKLAELEKKAEAALAEKDEMEEKMLVLADKLEEYRSQENIIRNALINAERMKESLLTEAQQTAEILLKDAQNKADKIVEAATSKVAGEEAKFNKVQSEVVNFKNSIIELYKQHINLISDLPDEQDIRTVDYDEPETAPVDEEPAFADPVYADDIPDLTLGNEGEQAEVETVAADPDLVAQLTSELIANGEAPAGGLGEAEEEEKDGEYSGRFDFDDKFGF